MLKKTLRPILVMTLSVCMIFVFSSCGTSGSFDASKTDATKAMIKNYDQNSSALKFSSSKWHYDKTHDVYWRTGIHYCAKPETTDYETMGIYVPGKYFDGTKNSDGTYTCTPRADGAVGSYTAATAPVVVPVNTPGYSASAAPTEYAYDGVADYLAAGFVYLQPGIRGRSNMGGTADRDEAYSGGAPWGVTDVKAAVRYFRYNRDVLPRLVISRICQCAGQRDVGGRIAKGYLLRLIWIRLFRRLRPVRWGWLALLEFQGQAHAVL